MIKEAEVRTRRIRGLVRTRAFLERGGRVIIRGSTGSTPRDCAGGPSIRMSDRFLATCFHDQWFRKRGRRDLLIHSICIAFSGFLNPRTVLKRTNDNAATLVLSWKVMKF